MSENYTESGAPMIYEAITAIMNEGAVVGKNQKNKQGEGYMYRGIDDVMNAFQPLLAKHGIFVVPEVLDRERYERTTKSGSVLFYSVMKIRYTFYAKDGSSVSAVVIGEGMDSGDKASNKAMSVGMKYAMFQVFCIPTEEMVDPDAETPEELAPEQPQHSQAYLDAVAAGKAVIELVKDADSANAAIPAMKQIAHADGSDEIVGILFNRKVKSLGLVFADGAYREGAKNDK